MRRLSILFGQFSTYAIACDRASSPGRSGSGTGMERELATTSLEFENLHRKSQREMLIGGDNISKMSLPLVRVFQCLFTFALVFASR